MPVRKMINGYTPIYMHKIEEHFKERLSTCNINRRRFRELRSAAASLLGLGVRMPPGAFMSVPFECFVLSGRVFARGRSLNQRSPAECVCVCVCVVCVWVCVCGVCCVCVCVSQAKNIYLIEDV